MINQRVLLEIDLGDEQENDQKGPNQSARENAGRGCVGKRVDAREGKNAFTTMSSKSIPFAINRFY